MDVKCLENNRRDPDLLSRGQLQAPHSWQRHNQNEKIADDINDPQSNIQGFILAPWARDSSPV